MLDLLLPQTCAACGRAGPAPCATCWEALQPAGALAAIPNVDDAVALLRYDGPGRELVARLKYRNRRSAVGWLAGGMAALVAPRLAGFAPTEVVVTWAPTTAARRRSRGFDQAEVLARTVAGDLGVPVAGLLSRASTGSQTGQSASDRRRTVAFDLRSPGPSGYEAVVLVDDVVTTGSTLAGAAAALRASGVGYVFAVAAAATPLKAGR